MRSRKHRSSRCPRPTPSFRTERTPHRAFHAHDNTRKVIVRPHRETMLDNPPMSATAAPTTAQNTHTAAEQHAHASFHLPPPPPPHALARYGART